MLVALGAAAFTDLGARIAGTDGTARVVSYVVSGIGFLGAGVIAASKQVDGRAGTIASSSRG